MDSALPPFAAFDPAEVPLPPGFEVLHPGRFGGKARGLLYAAHLLQRGEPLAGEHTHRLRLPPSALLGTDLFETVAGRPGVAEAVADGSSAEAHAAVLREPLPPAVRAVLLDWLSRVREPLAVRSSSLMEDDPRHSFSGVYETRFVANAGDDERRLAELEEAVRHVLASTFLADAEAYRRRRGIPRARERMAILLQHLVGRRRGGMFYPLVGGVAFSRNMYPWTDRVSVEDGVARVCYGLGTSAVDRGHARVFVPARPRLRPEGFDVEAIEEYAQDAADVLDLDAGMYRRGVPLRDLLDVPDNGLHHVASLVREGEVLKTPRFPLVRDDRFVVTFDEILAGRTSLPLAPVLRALLASLTERLECPVDVEFAVPAFLPDGEPPPVHLLQVRPLGVREAHRRVDVDPGGHDLLFGSTRVMGNGERRDLRHAIVVLARDYVDCRPDRVVREVRRLDRALDGAPYLLVGPGRWGSSNPALGVPAGYDAIAGAAVIVEVAAGPMAPEVSYGTHFFGDLLASGTFYLAVLPDRGDTLDEALLLRHGGAARHGVRLVTFPRPVVVQVDGAGRRAVVFLPAGGGAPP